MHLTLHLDLCFQAQTLPCATLRKGKLRLSYMPWQRVTCIKRAGEQRLPELGADTYAERSGHTGDTIVRKTDDQAWLASLFIGPNPRRPHAVAYRPGQAIQCAEIGGVISLEAFCRDPVPVPQRKIVRSHVMSVPDDVVGICNSLVEAQAIRRAVGNSRLHRGSRPGWTVAQRLDLF